MQWASWSLLETIFLMLLLNRQFFSTCGQSTVLGQRDSDILSFILPRYDVYSDQSIDIDGYMSLAAFEIAPNSCCGTY